MAQITTTNEKKDSFVLDKRSMSPTAFRTSQGRLVFHPSCLPGRQCPSGYENQRLRRVYHPQRRHPLV